MVGAAEIIDLEALRRLFRAIGENPEDMRDIFTSFAEDSPELFETMLAAEERHDWPALKRAAHSLKGAARDFGAHEMADICASLEGDAKEGLVAGVNERICAARDAFGTAVAALETLLNSNELFPDDAREP